MKDYTTGYFITAIVFVIVVSYFTLKDKNRTERSTSFVGYSQSCWQVGDTLHVVTAKGDTVRLDVSKLK